MPELARWRAARAAWARRAAAAPLGLLLAALCVHGARASDGPARFPDLLEGAWSGRAVTTPVGPRPYDIDFRRTPEGHLDGAAHPGGATHHWSFRHHERRLVLRFLSTFAGNTDPIWLDAVDPDAAELAFQARHPAFLRVLVRPGVSDTRIRIYHGERLHVEVHLTRRRAGSGS